MTRPPMQRRPEPGPQRRLQRTPRRLRLALILGLPAMAACGWWMAGRSDGPGGDVLSFPHALHVADFGLECAECHGAVAEATNLSTSFLPMEEVCLDCHIREDDCQLCHSDPTHRSPREVREATLAFSHANHIERVEGADCTTCHADVLTSENLPLAQPAHAQCMSCHEHEQDYAAANCRQCHASMGRLPLEAVAEFDHGGDWLSRHPMMARSAGAACLQCHSEGMCTDCHSTVPAAAPARLFPEQVERSLLHRGDFLSTHPIEARADADMCLRCHDTQFCEDCHTVSGLTPAAQSPLFPHPSGWLDPSSANFHGREARLQIVACASCHDQGAASNCVSCHRVGGIGGNPHPPGWSGRYELEDTRGNPMCQTCHSGGL